MTLPVFLNIEATVNPNACEALEVYNHRVVAVLTQHGGIPIASYDVEKALDNLEVPHQFKVISFPSRQAIHDFFAASEYRAIEPLRDEAFRRIRFFITSERI